MCISARSMLLGAGLILAVGASTAHAASITQRTSAYNITFGGGGLDTATTSYTVTAILPPGGSNSVGALSLKTGWQNLSFSTTGGVTNAYVVPPPGSPSASGEIDNNGAGGTWTDHYTTATGPDFTHSWTITSNVGGLNALSFGGIGGQGFGGGGAGLCDIGCSFIVGVTIQGDWSTPGTATGDHQLTNLNAGWTISDDFVYDPMTMTTFFRAFNTNYQGNVSTPGGNANLGFNLYGSPVPEPASLALLTTGAFGLLLLHRRRRG